MLLMMHMKVDLSTVKYPMAVKGPSVSTILNTMHKKRLREFRLHINNVYHAKLLLPKCR